MNIAIILSALDNTHKYLLDVTEHLYNLMCLTRPHSGTTTFYMPEARSQTQVRIDLYLVTLASLTPPHAPSVFARASQS